jgi:hypothetical protein
LVLTVGAEHLVQVDPEDRDVVEATEIVHQALAVMAYSVHRTLPAHPELLGHRGADLANFPADLCGRPSGHESSM